MVSYRWRGGIYLPCPMYTHGMQHATFHGVTGQIIHWQMKSYKGKNNMRTF